MDRAISQRLRHLPSDTQKTHRASEYRKCKHEKAPADLVGGILLPVDDIYGHDDGQDFRRRQRRVRHCRVVKPADQKPDLQRDQHNADKQTAGQDFHDLAHILILSQTHVCRTCTPSTLCSDCTEKRHLHSVHLKMSLTFSPL